MSEIEGVRLAWHRKLSANFAQIHANLSALEALRPQRNRCAGLRKERLPAETCCKMHSAAKARIAGSVMTMRDYPFDEAVEVFGDPQIVARLRSLDPADDRIFENGAYTQGAISRKLREKLHEALIAALCEGSLIASYRDRSRPGRYRRSDLEPAWWRIAEVDFDEFGNAHEVEGPAFEDIRVRRADADTTEAAPQGEQELDEGTRLQWSKRRRILTLDGKELYFQGDVQLAIVDELYRAFVAGRRRGLNDILTTANSKADTLAKAFSGNRNWPVLKTIIRVRHRECWFDLSGN